MFDRNLNEFNKNVEFIVVTSASFTASHCYKASHKNNKNKNT